jgi:uncharacterized protein (TIGR02099 family)
VARLLKRQLRFWVRAFWGVVLFVVISLAVLVQLGRALFPVLDDYRELAEQQLSAQLGVEVRVRGIQAQWKGLRPRLTLTDVAVYNAGETVFSITDVSAEISLLSSLRDWRLAFRRLSFSGLTTTLEQNPEGLWWMRGLDRAARTAQVEVPVNAAPPPIEPPPPATPPEPPPPVPGAELQRTAMRDPLDLFLFGRRLELKDTRLDLVFRSGQVTQLEIPEIRLENDTDFHRLSARFSLDHDRQSLYLVVEGQGNPRDHASFDARGYLQLRQFPSEKVLAALGVTSEALLVQTDPLQPDGRVTMDLWFQGTASRGMKWQGSLDLLGSPLQPPQGVRWPESMSANLNGTWQPREGWQMQFTDTRFRWSELTAPPLDLELRGQLAGETRLALAALDLGEWSKLILDAGALQGEAREALEALRPEGRLSNLEVRRRPAEEGYFTLRAQVANGSVQARLGAPALQGINGLVEASAFDGQMHLRSDTGFSLFFPRIYHHPLEFLQASGTVRWRLDPAANWVGISSSTVHLTNEAVAATGHFSLNLPLHADPQREPELTLVIGVERGAASLHRLLVPYTVPQQLYEWLGRSIEAGELRRVGFIYHGSLLKDPDHVCRVIQLRAEVTGAQVAFDPEWPPLRDASGLIYLDDEALRVSDLRGRLGEVTVADGVVTLERPTLEDRALRIRGQLNGDGGQARGLLDQSPLRDLGGSEVASWRWSGGVVADVDVLLPLSEGAEAAQKVDLIFSDARLSMPNLDLEFEALHGPLHYDSALGLSSPGFDARLWGQDLRMALTSRGEADGRLLVGDFTGTVDMARLRTWSNRSELAFAHGTAAVTGRLTVPLSGEGKLRLALTSPLEGVRVEVPGLLSKTTDQPAPLSLVVESGEVAGARQQSYLFDLQDRGQLLVLNRDGRVLSADLAVGEAASPALAGQFRIHGYLEHLDALAWGTLLARLAQPAAASSESAAPPMAVNLDLRIGRLQVQDLVLEDFGLSGGGSGTEWKVILDQSQVAGTVQLAAGQPLRLELSRLHLPGVPEAPPAEVEQQTEPVLAAEQSPPQEAAPPAPDVWDQLVFASAPSVDFQVRDLRRGTRALGDWGAKVRPTANGLLAYDLHAEAFGLKVGGGDTAGAELVWLRTLHGHTSYFSGVVEARDLAESFRQLGLAPVLSSERARFTLDLQWPTPPSRLTLEQALGVVHLDVERGLFMRSGSVGENPLLKLIGLLNFDTLARRLRLDFSDLSVSGLGYETIQGSLLFDSGVIRIEQPLQVATPSSHLQLVGEINALNETLDTHLVATLPLAGNLTVAAALTGGVPLAVGVYLTGKLFKTQVERASSLRYQVNGTWDDPEVHLERIFESRVPDAPGGENAH